MPIYEYECPECGRFETIQKFSDKPLKQCPHCKEAGRKNSVQKAVSASAFHLKGSGWYKTDYSSSSSASGAAKKQESSSSGESKSDTPAASGKACGVGCGCH